MRPQSIIRTLAAAALLIVPTVALAAPDQNTNGNNGCPNGQWRNNAGQCVGNTNGNYNGNGQWNNNNNNGRNGRHDGDDNRGRGRDRDRDRDRDDRNGNNGQNNNGQYNNGQYGNGQYNGGYNNGGYGNGQYNGGYNNGGYNNGRYGRSGNLSGVVSSFSPYNLYLSNGTHVQLHDGTVINPRGTNLTSGQRVRIQGTWSGNGLFNANQIDVVGNGGYRY